MERKLEIKHHAITTEHEMANCGMPNCRSGVSNRSQAGDGGFKGTCGLPDCHNNQAARSVGNAESQAGQSRAPPGPDPCELPGCQDPEAAAAGKEVCLYRARDTSAWGRLNDSYNMFWGVVKKVQTDPFYWALFKASVYFVLGLKLFRDLATEFKPIPKCGGRRR